MENVSVLVAIGVGADGRREALAVAEGMKEDVESRREFITGIIARGLKGVRLVTGDRCTGPVAAVGELLPKARCQRCMVHFERDILAKPNPGNRDWAADALKAVFSMETSVCQVGVCVFEVVTFFWTPRPGREPFYGEVQQGAARQGRGPVHQIRALRRGRDTRTRLSQQGDAAGAVPGMPRGGTRRKTVHSRETVPAVHGRAETAVPGNLTSREKAILVKQTSEKLGVTAGGLLPMVGIACSTYHYRLNAMRRPDKDAPLLELVREAFENSERRYGYKRIHLELKGMGVRVSAKRIMRLMTSHGLVPLFKSAKRYSSYKGELTKAPKNLVNRDFHAERPNMLWVTDLTEFSIPAGKAYLSPVIDCYDGMPVAWTIGTSPNAELANGMLTDACSTLKDGEKPIIHSD